MSETFTPKNLIAGGRINPITEDVTIQKGSNLKAGTVLGKITANPGSIPSVVGTGNGVMQNLKAQRDTIVGAYSILCHTKVAGGGIFSVTDPLGRSLPDALAGSYTGTGNGVLTEVAGNDTKTQTGRYSVKCITAIANGGIFEVKSPSGVVLGNVTIATSSFGIFSHEEISFKLADGSTDFIVGDIFEVAPYNTLGLAFNLVAGSTDFEVDDVFTVTVVVASRECVIVDSSASNGSQTPYAVLSEDVDATLEAKKSVGYLAGGFNEDALIFGDTDTKETFRAALRALSIYLFTVA